ncbi:MAG: hypothetical protein KF841_15175 [Phycisphaerae bacterium]|nr:hypothetical protein [Phycisphaerae bacterium]
MHDSPMPDHREETRNAFGILVFIARAMAVTVEVFLHRADSFGERYLGLQVIGGMVMIVFWPILCDPGYPPEPLLIFLATFILMCVAVRLRTNRRITRDCPQPHSRYNGTPRLMRITGITSEVTVKRVVEPIVMWLTGAFMLSVSPPLGGYLMVTAGSLFITNSLTDGYERRRAVDMHDAYLEQRNVAERFRDMKDK